MPTFVFIIFSTLFGIGGQLSLKQGMSHMHDSKKGLIGYMLTSPWVIGGLLVYGFGVIFWLLTLSRLEISYAYPFASLSYVGIIIGSYFIFKEKITPLRLLGIAVIIAGVLITSQS
jgi:multidrug transporter EmrE-like cation transporter